MQFFSQKWWPEIPLLRRDRIMQHICQLNFQMEWILTKKARNNRDVKVHPFALLYYNNNFFPFFIFVGLPLYFFSGKVLPGYMNKTFQDY